MSLFFCCSLRLLLPLLLLQTGGTRSAGSLQNQADPTVRFEQFVSRQQFPTASSPPFPPHFSHDNCSVSICEGPLAPIFCSGFLISTAWFYGVQGQCPGSKLLHEPAIVMANFKRKFAAVLHEIWPLLSRQFIDEVNLNQDRYPVIHVPNRFLVPGGFFKLYFYWDTFWILKGCLYFSNLIETARGMLENFAHLLRFRGFIPNSGNVQLSRRSQPPLFSQMIADYFDATGNKSFLAEYLPRAELELNWWRENRSVELELDGQRYSLFRYKAITDCPRPENFLEDYQLGMEANNSMFFWSSTASACESGLDFSSRWYKWGTAPNAMRRTAIATSEVVPLDLNVFMALNYRTLGKLYGDVLNEHEDKKKRMQDQCHKVVEYLKRIGALGFRGGIPSSLERNSNEQWDFPNGWAPQQHLFVLSLLQCQNVSGEAAGMARKVADAFLTTAYNGLFSPAKEKPAQIWEKYDVRFDNGQPGFGGEYPAQSGFGWTNGVIFEFIRMFYTKAESASPAEEEGEDANGSSRDSLMALESITAILQTFGKESLNF
uniref:Trehalase n=1 Tax=Globodera pallida TaxID=36090 RepID=A0A183C2J6_GLOPA